MSQLLARSHRWPPLAGFQPLGVTPGYCILRRPDGAAVAVPVARLSPGLVERLLGHDEALTALLGQGGRLEDRLRAACADRGPLTGAELWRMGYQADASGRLRARPGAGATVAR